jgi:hypothetical protein
MLGIFLEKVAYFLLSFFPPYVKKIARKKMRNLDVPLKRFYA